MKHYISCFFVLLLFTFSCKEEKLTYKKIETKDYYIEGYTYINNTNKIFPTELVLIDKTSKDTLYNCQDCFNDFHMVLEDTLLIYGGRKKKDSVIASGIILKRIQVSQDYRYNLPFKK